MHYEAFGRSSRQVVVSSRMNIFMVWSGITETHNCRLELLKQLTGLIINTSPGPFQAV